MVRDAGVASVRLSATPDSVGGARHAVRSALTDWQLEHLADTATLLVSELATNVLLHARSEFEVRAERRRGALRVSVLDSSPRPAVRRRYGLDAGTGRGLGILQTLASQWGCVPASDPWAKAVWFELSDDAGAQQATPEGALYGEDWLTLVDEL
jgi:anti-sigma regulatory factor (Ser/Thr protein kinase)